MRLRQGSHRQEGKILEKITGIGTQMSHSMFDIYGKNAIITGGHRGLGKGIATGFAEAGCNLAIVSRTVSEDFVREMESYGIRCRKYNCDVSDIKNHASLIDEILSEFGTIDILVNNAGIQSRHPAEEFPQKEWDRIMSVNCDAVFFLCQRVGAHMLANGYGKIINIVSINSFQGRKNIAAYAATKGAVASFSKTLANEWSSRGICVNCIMPGFFSTDLTKDILNNPDNKEELLARIPMGRFGEAYDLAGAAIFLASRASDYVSGHILCVDGGWMSA